MNRLVIFFGIILFVGCDSASNIAPPDLSYFVKYFGGDGNQFAVDMVVDTDGSIYILGNSQKSSADNRQIYIAKANVRGQIIWERTFGNVYTEAKDLELTSDGNLILVANQKTSENDWDIFVMKFSKDSMKIGSAVLWSIIGDNPLTSNPNKNDYVNSITELSNGNFILTGYTDNVKISGHEFDILNIQIDPSLKKVTFPWGETTGSGIQNYGRKAIERIQSIPKLDSAYVFGNVMYGADQNVWYGGLPKNGYGSNNSDDPSIPIFASPLTNDVLTSVIKDDGGYFLTSVSTSTTLPYNSTLKLYDIGLVFPSFISSDVTSYFEWPLGSFSEANANASACKASSGYLIVTDFSKSSSNTDIMLMKLRLDNLLKDPVYFGGPGNDRSAAVAELPDGHILVLGTMQLGNPPEQYKIALIKVNANGRFE